MDMKDDLDLELQAKLQKLQPGKSRDESAVALGKARFLMEARQLSVTSTGLKRLTL